MARGDSRIDSIGDGYLCWLQLLSNTFTGGQPPPARAHTGKRINEFDAVIHMQESPPHKRFLLSSDAAHPSCDSPNTSRRVALGASNVCLVDEISTCSVPAL